MSSFSIAAAGMQRASALFEQSAGRIARTGTGIGEVDLATEMVNVLQAETDFKASAKVAGIAADMSKHLIDILA